MFLLSNQINKRTAPQERTPVAEGQNWTRYGIPAGARYKIFVYKCVKIYFSHTVGVRRRNFKVSGNRIKISFRGVQGCTPLHRRRVKGMFELNNHFINKFRQVNRRTDFFGNS